MASFIVRYWFGDEAAPPASAYVSEHVDADTAEAAERQVREKLEQEFFGIDSDAHGRVVVNRHALRFCSILPAQPPEEAEAQNRLLAAADPPAERRQRLTQAAEDVDNDVRRF